MPDLHRLVHNYVQKWESRGYANGIPDEVPDLLMRYGLAPSYKEICVSILQHTPYRLAASAPNSNWYGALKGIEIDGRKDSVT